MHLSVILVTLACYVSASYALCYPSGRLGNYGKWLKEKEPTIDKERLSIACSALVGRGDVSFAKGESRRTCMQEDLRTKWDFKIERLSEPKSDGTATMTMDVCLEYLRKEAYGCKYGGRIKYWDWGIE
ncbi:hypothetical protein CTA1_8413 [Colletotrichum tanaceti]|uniref:Secreted protein n=1 Tax=Colletotrichum tanaceti TaxID=1306861 RepID=A0A4V6DFV3_9PEZI|nr:hypothetical protein CTA1_8413 [Colletotrichum tanaceti]